MPHAAHKEQPVWMLPFLWGFDVALAAMFWALASATHLQITMVAEGPILLLVTSVWAFTIATRVHAAVHYRSGWYHDYYENHAFPMLLMAGAVAAATLWMLCYYVGRHVLPFAIIPALFLFLASMPLRHGAMFKGLCKSIAFGFACLVPAFSMSFALTPLDMLYCAPCWYIGVLFFLFQRERARWKEDQATPHRHSGILLGGLFLLLLICTLSTGGSPYFEHSLSITIAMGAACLMLLAKIRPNLSDRCLFCLCWPVMTLPALLGILLY